MRQVRKYAIPSGLEGADRFDPKLDLVTLPTVERELLHQFREPQALQAAGDRPADLRLAACSC
jgi:hypothetical protein